MPIIFDMKHIYPVTVLVMVIITAVLTLVGSLSSVATPGTKIKGETGAVKVQPQALAQINGE